MLAYLDITDLVIASRIKDEFVASVSHELRTPLTSIIGYVDIILDDTEGLPDDVRDYLVTVQRNARRLHRLVDDLLSTALHSVTTVLDVERLAVASCWSARPARPPRPRVAAGLTFEIDISTPAAPRINGDTERLARSSTTCSATRSSTRLPAATWRSTTVEDDHALIRVTDTGRGISEAELDAIFNKFFRSTTVMIDAIPGIGLGLAISKTIIDAHGGKISVSSTLGQGATFEVRLPLADPCRCWSPDARAAPGVGGGSLPVVPTAGDNGRMPLYSDEAIVLRTHKLAEADRIITLLTREHGVVRAVAKGVRRTSSRFGSRLEPFTHVDLQLAVGRNLDTITQADTARPTAPHLGRLRPVHRRKRDARDRGAAGLRGAPTVGAAVPPARRRPARADGRRAPVR